MQGVRVEEPDDLLAPERLHNDAHFLRAVTDMADKKEVVTGGAIYSETGIKLLEKGVRLDSRLYEQLIQHKLATPIDEQLLIRNGVDVRAIEEEVLRLCSESALGRSLQAHLGADSHMLLEAVRQMPWPYQASFKMSVMREQLPVLYAHSITMMMSAVYLGIKSGMKTRECGQLAAAAMLHDVGMLYMPPSWLNRNHKLTDQERKHLAAHCVTGMLVVRNCKAYSREIEEAVLEHHERMDGSGYPRGISGDAISSMGRILMLAEVVSAFYDKYRDMPAQRLSLVLRMNHNRFDRQLMQHVHAMLRVDTAQPVQAREHTQAEVRREIATLAAIFQQWMLCKRQFPERWQAMPSGRAGVYVDARLVALEKALAEAGSHPRQQADWLAMFEEDPSSMSELVLINREALWQVENCIDACTRRWPQIVQHPQSLFEKAMAEWINTCKQVLGGKPAAADS